MIDLTYSLSESTVVHAVKTPFTRKVCACYEKGAKYEDMTLSTGVGTHMDAPHHFFPEGKTIDQIPLEQCFGPACVLHLDVVDYAISADDIERWEEANGQIEAGSIVFAHTGWDRLWGREEFVCTFPGFSEEAAKLLVKRKVKGVGIDTTGIDPWNVERGLAHIVFLKEGIWLVENLANLGKLPPKGSYVYVLPMKIEGAPEAPVRAFAQIKN